MPLVAEKSRPALNQSNKRDFFGLSLEMAEISEALLEEQGVYSKEFLTGLKSSFNSVGTGYGE